MWANLLEFMRRQRWWIAAAIALIAIASLAVYAWRDFLAFQIRSAAETQKAGLESAHLAELLAQRWSAEYAYGALLVALFGLLVSVLATLGVMAAFWQNRQLIRTTRELGENQTRAYIIPNGVTLEITTDNPCVTCQIKLRHMGETPAVQVSLDGHLAPAQIGNAYKADVNLPMLGTHANIVHESTTTMTIVAFEDDYADWLEAAFLTDRTKALRRGFILNGRIEYRDVFNTRWRVRFEAAGFLPDRGYAAKDIKFLTGSGPVFEKIDDAGRRID